MIWGSKAYPLAVYELFIFLHAYRVFCFAVFLILLFPILLFLFFGQALNFSLVAPEPKSFPALLGGGGGGGGGGVRVSGATKLLAHTSICS